MEGRLVEWGLGLIAGLLAVVWKERKGATDRLDARVAALEQVSCSREELSAGFDEVKTLIRDMDRKQEDNRKELKASIDRVHSRIDETNKTVLDLVRRKEV